MSSTRVVGGALPDWLSLSRLLLAPAVAWALVGGAVWTGAGLFLLAVLTDVLDGRLARWHGVATVRGTLLDHGADAVFVTTVLTTAAVLGLVPLLLPPLIGLAFLQYARDVSRARVPPAAWLGRINGIGYYVLAAAALLAPALGELPAFAAGLVACAWLLVVSTLAAIVLRAWPRPGA